MDGAGAALTVITTFLRAGESNGLADAIQQGRTRVDAKMVVLAINAERDWDRTLNIGRVCDCCRRATLCGRASRCTPSYDCGRRRASNCPQKIPASRIW